LRAPGSLAELGPAGAQAWEDRVGGLLRALPRDSLLQPAPSADTPGLTAPDWTGFPTRVAECLTRAQALRLLDRTRALQEEYVEWRVVRDGDTIRRVELTTELADYWRVLAAHEPERTLELVAEFAGERPADVHDGLDPQALLTGPYNDGTHAICCMVQRSNTLEALLALAAAATTPRIVRDVVSGRLRCLTCDESIPMFEGAAQLGRSSDPVLVERFGRLAFEGRLVALDDPVGVYIAGVEQTRLRTPDGEPVPSEWFQLTRGGQRLVLAPQGMAVSDLVDVATEQPIRHGGQIAELVQLKLRLRVSEPGVVGSEMPEPVELERAAADPRDCAEVRRKHEAFLS
jgi:hypothetical protein